MKFDSRWRAISSALKFVAISSLLTTAAAGCRAVIDAHGGSLSQGKANADSLAMAFEHRFTNVERAPKYAHARMRFARYAFAPSKLINDTALWTHVSSTATGTVRTLELAANFRNGSYIFEPSRGATLPTQTGGERHLIKLSELGNNDWHWSTEVDHASGSIAVANVEPILNAIFASLERGERDVRNDYRSTMPATTIAMARLMKLDSLITAPQSDGSTVVKVALRVDSDALGPDFPNFAKYVKKYVGPSSLSIKLLDKSGAEWFRVTSSSYNMLINFRSARGILQPLTGSARRMPDTLGVQINARAKLGVFTVGVSQLQGQFIHIENVRERGWKLVFTKEPQWHLPLISERLLRSPLKRPFENQGVQFQIGFKHSPNTPTQFSRNLSLVVRESAIMRFLGNLGFGAMNDFAGKVEQEENNFLAQLFAAIRSDVRKL